MAIVTGELYKGFTFGGISSKAYGVYITQEAAYDAPERDTEVVEIAGRNGAYILDKGRFKNITVSYKCGIALDSEHTFESAIRTFRNALSSKAGKYVRLEDEYNPNEYRQAAFLGGIEVDMADRRAGEFTVSFDAMPQRFLKSGEIPRTIGGDVTNTQTRSGAVVALESDGGDAVTSLVAQITPKQAGSGDPSQSNVRPITGTSTANVFVTGFNQWDEEWEVGALSATGGNATSSTEIRSKNYIPVVGGQTYYLYCAVPSTFNYKFYDADKNFISGAYIGRNNTLLIPNDARYMRFFMGAAYGTTYNHDISINYPSTDTEYHTYTGHTTTVPLGQTVYGGTLDVVSGVLTVDRAMVDLGTRTYSKEFEGVFYSDVTALSMKRQPNTAVASDVISSLYATKSVNAIQTSKSGVGYYTYTGNNHTYLYIGDSRYSTGADLKQALNGMQLVYELATPQTYNLTAQQVELLAGNNNVWSDTGDTTLTYGRDPNKIVNPTLFESHPLLMTKGYGNITIGTDAIDINNDPYGRLLLANAKATSGYIDLDAGNMALMNTGDAITLSDGTTWRLVLTATATPSIAGIASVTASVSGTLSGSVNAFAQGNTGYFDITIGDVGFVKGTTRSLTMTLDIGWTNNQGTTYSATVSYRCRFIASSNQIQFDKIANGVTSPYQLAQLGNVFRVADVYGDSTKTPLNETVYIDTDIGEAYTEAGGVVSSANALVSLPAKLPTLKSGANTITYDDTITQFQVVPRWWEV